ncbi:MAG: HAMP domain-containing protein [Ktedonobacteraceae bacterium]|nr:HAMP domain-containing protein [Ktedonobacteraceae bacterium]
MIARLRSISPPGIRLQLTCWYTLVSAILVLLFSFAFYQVMQQSLAASLDTTLQLQAQQVAEGVTLHNGGLLVDRVVNELPELEATAALVDSSRDFAGDVSADSQTRAAGADVNRHMAIRILDLRGRVVYVTPPFQQLAVPAQSIADPLGGVPWRGTVTGQSKEQFRLYSTMLVDSGKIIGVVQIGQSLAKMNAALQQIVQGLFLFTLLALTLCAVGSYWLAGRAFRPMRRLMQTAREIGAKDLHQRVPVPRSHDEVRELAVIFNQMIGRLEEAFVLQRRFVADASHELRTPVAVIRSMTDVALSHPEEGADNTAVLREVNAEAERLGKLIGELLALARADEGQIRLDYEPVRIDLLTADVVDSLESLAVERRIALRVQRLDAATVRGDAARLIQMLMSLVDNALIYTNAGGWVTVCVVVCAAHVHVSVADTGIGIAPSDIKHIFERFYRADPARSKAGGGSGLGLSIADWVVRAHRGVITVESQPGRGSVFTVTLPLMKVREHEQQWR